MSVVLATFVDSTVTTVMMVLELCRVLCPLPLLDELLVPLVVAFREARLNLMLVSPAVLPLALPATICLSLAELTTRVDWRTMFVTRLVRNWHLLLPKRMLLVLHSRCWPVAVVHRLTAP